MCLGYTQLKIRWEIIQSGLFVHLTLYFFPLKLLFSQKVFLNYMQLNYENKKG